MNLLFIFLGTLEGNQIFLYERDEKLKMVFPKILKLHEGEYKYKFSNTGSAMDKYIEISVCEIPDMSKYYALQYKCEIQFTEQD